MISTSGHDPGAGFQAVEPKPVTEFHGDGYRVVVTGAVFTGPLSVVDR
jgi:hypothetical protein